VFINIFFFNTDVFLFKNNNIVIFMTNEFLLSSRAHIFVAFPSCVGQSPAAVMVIEGYFQMR